MEGRQQLESRRIGAYVHNVVVLFEARRLRVQQVLETNEPTLKEHSLRGTGNRKQHDDSQGCRTPMACSAAVKG